MKNLKEQFVSFEISNKLKEKGFDEACLACYDNTELKQVLCLDFSAETNTEFAKSSSGYILAPLYQQVIDFILSKNVFVGVSDFPIYNGKYGYRYGRGMTSGGYTPHFEGTTRYEALTEAIKKALELIPKK